MSHNDQFLVAVDPSFKRADDYGRLRNAVFALYMSGHWHSDRLLAEVELMLWENVRVAAEIPLGIAPGKLYKTDQPIGKYEDIR